MASTTPDTPAGDTGDQETELSQRIRRLREEKGLSLRAMAREAGVSVSFLSQVENGKASPSIPTLIKMARSLDEHVAALFEPRSTSRLIRADERPQLLHPQRKWSEALLSPRDFRSLQVILSTVAPKGASAEEPFSYEAGETCALVVSGSVDFWLDGEKFKLRKGDCLAFDPSTPHRVENNGRSHAQILWASSPPAY